MRLGILTGLLLAAFGGVLPAEAARLPATVLIGLATGQRTLSLRLPPDTIVSSAAGTWTAGTETVLSCTATKEGEISAGSVNLGRGPVRFQPASGLLGFSSRLYRGTFLLATGPAGLTLVNEVGLEDYLCGVLPAEVSFTWPAEALKAQAVAARTFTIGRLGAHRQEGYDVCATTHCQVYAGAGAEKSATNDAVAATEGQVVTYGGRLASTYYHAASGGHTEDVESVWPGANPLAYLRGVPDPAESSPYGEWRLDLEWPALEALVAEKYPELPRLVGVNVVGRTPAGRIQTAELVGERGSVKIGGEALRSLLSLRSSMAEMTIEYAPAPVPNMEATTATPLLYALGPASESLWSGIWSGAWTMIPVRLHIIGRGWGHGVGMSQWGAKALAEMGYTYIMILKHYYQGVEVEDWRSPQASPPAQGGSTGAD